MKVRVLGCSGGIGEGRHTTSFLIDDDILIDAGTGLTRLDLAALGRIRHLFISHSHLDHILCLPTLLDSISDTLTEPLVVRALPEVIDSLRAHIFNGDIWPDFARIPSPEQPFMRYQTIRVGEAVRLGGREITAIPAHHGKPAVGYCMRGAHSSLIYSGDTRSHPALWDFANACPDIRHLIVETSFGNNQQALAEVSWHYCPATLLPDLDRLKPGVEVWITHLKPGNENAILDEIQAGAGRAPRALAVDQMFEL